MLHQVCVACEEFRQSYEALGSLDPKKCEIQAQWNTHNAHANALNLRTFKNRVKAIEGEDNNPGIRALDVSVGSDGLGSFGLRWISHKPFFGMSGMSRDNLLGIHTELTMVHNYGVFGHVGFPGIETCGADMTLNAIYRAVYLSLKGRPHIDKIRNLYISLDNTCSSNKCWTVMNGMASLVALGIAEKVVITFRLVDQDEVDQADGIVSNKISKKTMMTLDAWKEQIENAMRSQSGRCFDMRSIEFCYGGCPEYSHEFKAEYADKRKIKGLARVQEVRFAMHPTEDRVEMHYLSQGWLPRFVHLLKTKPVLTGVSLWCFLGRPYLQQKDSLVNTGSASQNLGTRTPTKVVLWQLKVLLCTRVQE
jgi:hypothetical protein